MPRNNAGTSTEKQQIPPQAVEESVTKGYDSPERLIFREEFEKTLKWVDERIANTNYIMGVLILVLFVGLLACLFSVFTMFQQAQTVNKELDFKTSIDNESKVVNQLIDTTNKLNSTIIKIQSETQNPPKPTP